MSLQPVERVFAYGSLRSGQKYRHRVDWLVADSRAGTMHGRMYHYAPTGAHGEFPYILPGNEIVHGELLRFSDFAAALRVIDALEEHPYVFVRRMVIVQVAQGAAEQAFAYFIQPGQERRGDRVRGGDWAAELRRLGRPARRGKAAIPARADRW